MLTHYGKAAAWAHRLCVEQPTTTNKQGRTTVRYPRGAEAERELHAEATEALMRAKTPDAALAVVLRLLVAQRLADTDGLPNADRQGIYEPRELAASKVLDKLAGRVAPASVKKRLAEREAEREHQEEACREERAAKLAEQRAKLEAGEPCAASAASAPLTSSPTPPRSTAHSSTPETARASAAAPATTPTRPTDAADPPPSGAARSLHSTQGTYAS